jgi:hypothetical protein
LLIVLSNAHCVIVLFFFVLCTLSCQFFWIVHSWFLFNDSLVLFLSIQIVMFCVVVYLYHAYFGFTINSNISLNVLKRVLGKIYLTCFILIYQPTYLHISNQITRLTLNNHNHSYDFRIKTMFGSSLPPIVCRRAHVLITLLELIWFIRVHVAHLFSFLLCTLCF